MSTSSPESPIAAVVRAVGAASVAIGVFHFISTTAWLSSLFVISLGALLVQLGTRLPHAPKACCATPGMLVALRDDMVARPAEPNLACCGCGHPTGCLSYIDTVRNVAIATIFFSFAEWLITFVIALVVAIHAYKPKMFDAHSFELRGIRYAMYVAGSITSAGFVHIVLAILALQTLQGLRVFARLNPSSVVPPMVVRTAEAAAVPVYEFASVSKTGAYNAPPAGAYAPQAPAATLAGPSPYPQVYAQYASAGAGPYRAPYGGKMPTL
jgi:hypothetical protein